MKNLNFLSNLCGLGRASQSSDVGSRCRVVADLLPSFCRVNMLKLVSVLVLILTLGVGNAWGVSNGDTFTRISAVGDLADGDEIIFVNQAETYACGTTQNTNNRTPVSITTSSHSYTYNSSHNVQVFVVKINASGKFGFHTGTGYLYSKSSSKNQTNTNTTSASTAPSGTSAWSLSVSSYVCTITNVSNTSYYLAFNGTDYFTQYSSGYVKPYIYKKQAASTPTITTSVSSLTEVGYSTADFSQQVKSFTVSGSSLTANVTVTAPTNYEVCKTSGGTYTSSVSFDKGSGTLAASTVYVRLQSGKTAGNYSGNVACSSSGATTKNVAVSGSVPYTITWSANGSTFATTYVAVGGTLTLPGSKPDPATYSCTGKYFFGWYGLGSSYSHASTAPTIAATGNAVNADKTYYAVFADRSGSGDVTWDKVTSAPSDWSGDYVIVASDNANAMISDFHSGTSGEFKSASVTINAAGTQITSTPTDKMIWTFAKNGSNAQYSLKNKSTSTYAQITGTGSTAAALNASAVWFTIESSGTSGVWKVVSVSYSARCFAWYSSNSSFRTYAKSTNNTGRLFKKSGDGYTWSNYATTCCTALGSINGSSNLSTSSTGTSVSVEVLTAGVNAYGDANNVSGYDFKLYTASAGGSAAATYSSDSKAGTSHTFTGLTPLTQYWVTVRPIGSGSYCNTTAESDRVAIYTCPGSPNHVDVSGRWDRFGGETISLTAAAYATDGTGTAIPAAKITGYQWQKWYNSQWNNISNAGTTSGATTNNLQITSCSNENSGSYRCVVSTVAGCDIESDGFQVKVYVLECYTGGTTTYNFTRVGDTQAGTAQITLTAGNKEFKVHADNDYYGKNETINEDVTNVVLCNSGDAVCSSNLTIAAGLGGTFTINMEYSTSGSSSVEGEPEISVTYPRKTLYLTPGVWNTGGAKFAFYYYRDAGSSGWTDFITANDCGSSADIPQWNGVKINAVRLSDECSSPDWSDKWNQTSNITITSNNSVSITGWGPDKGDSPYDYGTYAVPTYTISYAKGSVPTGGGSISGSKADESKTCGVNFTLPSSAVFTTTGYTQTGWATEDGGSKAYNLGGSYTTNAAQAFYPAWTANNHTLTWDANGGDALTGDYTTGTVAYGTAITAPNTPTWTGHTFGGWHNGSSVVTPATSMPDNDLTYTAQWSLATYTVTLNTNGGTINAGNVTSYTYGTGATLPTNVTKDGNRFDGWFDNKELDGDAVTSISSSATGNKEYWAKWTPVRTVTWSVNGSTWSSGVVEGNTHVISGEKVSALPTAPTKSDCDDAKVFVGWRATAIDGTSTSDPGGIFTDVAGSPAIDANKTFYAVFADASPRQVISLTFPDDNSDNNGLTSNQYTSEWTAKAGTFSFTVNNFNNNNWGGSWKWIKCGRKSYTSVAKITTDTDVDFRVDSVYITIGSIADSYVNSAKLQISSSSDFGTKTEMDIPQSTGTQKLKIASPATDKYYRIVYDCASHPSSNGFVQINSLEFIQKSETSNYVTTCASCDENATYTKTTPTVSDIDCTTATLTMEDGLATVGADGCHVSDYGFVIGTSDNPAVGGVGVTKLQVGTSDPTIGADFSYDVTGLTKGTRYYIRAYATNLHGTAYSTSTNFWTKDVSSIAITTAPTKTNYLVGETFDATGMVVTATLASSATEDVTSDVTYSSSALTAGTSQNFAINYTLCETAKSVNQVINVYTLTVTEGTNQSYGTASGSVNIVSITGLGEHKTYTVTVTSSNATAVDNGDNTWTITNPTGNVAVRVDYAEAAQVKVYYKVDGVTVTSLTQDVYQSETTTLPTASELATAMTAQSMDIPDDDYPNFYGWSETEFPAQTAEPTIVTGTPTINAEKTYYAVYTNLNKITIIPSDFSTSYPSSGSADGTKTFGGKRFGWNYLLNGNVSKTNLPLQFKKNSTEYGRLYNTDPLNYILRIEIGYYNADSYVPVYVASGAGTISGGALTPASRESTDPYVYTMPASTSYFYIKGDNSTVYKIRSVDIYYSPATVYYMTQFCTNRVTLTQNSPEHGTIEFSRSSLATCGSDKNVSLTITPDVGYQLTGWTVNTASGYADAKTTSPAVVTNNNSSAAQNITLTFAENANKDYDVTATFGLMTVSSWTWTLNSAAIPDPLNLYIGQSAKLDVAYTPAGVDASKKTYTRTKVDAYINWSGAAQATYSTISGRASTGENTTEVTFTHADGPTTTVNVKVLPLPLVHFADIVHNVSFDDVVATLSDNTLSPTKTTPTHADFDGSALNTCEEQHLHLVGWIREDWPALVTYLEGGAQPTTSEITGAGNDGSGNAYFFTPGASINTQTFNGVTFYAVWAKVE